MKKKLSYRDKLLELAYIYSVKEIQDYTKNRKNLTTGQIELILKKNKIIIPKEFKTSFFKENFVKPVTKLKSNIINYKQEKIKDKNRFFFKNFTYNEIEEKGEGNEIIAKTSDGSYLQSKSGKLDNKKKLVKLDSGEFTSCSKIKNTKGELIARQDSDDYSNPERIYTQVRYLLKNNLDAVTSRALIIGSTKKIPGFSYFIPAKLLMKYKNPFIHGSLIIKKQVLNDLGLYDENFYYAQDYGSRYSTGYLFQVFL